MINCILHLCDCCTTKQQVKSYHHNVSKKTNFSIELYQCTIPWCISKNINENENVHLCYYGDVETNIVGNNTLWRHIKTRQTLRKTNMDNNNILCPNVPPLFIHFWLRSLQGCYDISPIWFVAYKDPNNPQWIVWESLRPHTHWQKNQTPERRRPSWGCWPYQHCLLITLPS